jgi:adenine-specific DNA-methyltransferase
MWEDALVAASLGLPTPLPLELDVPSPSALVRAASFPRLRYMGSKYRLLPDLAEVFTEVAPDTVLDAFSGSGVVSYLLKCLGYQVTSNDFLAFPGVIAEATVVNETTLLTPDIVDQICGPAADERDFIQRTFDGLYFTAEDRSFLDSAWSHIDLMCGAQRALAISALVLSAARKQPRGVFTFTGLRYDDGRRDLRLPLREHFRERVEEYNATVFESGRQHRALTGEVFDVDQHGFDLVYLDPPYAPPKDDNCYIKRYHFLEGLALYWRDQTIMEGTKTKKLPKRYTPFSYKHTVADALRALFERFHESTIVLSYSSNATPDAAIIEGMLRDYKRSVEVRRVDHRYSFGTHAAARRREVDEYLFIGR